MVRPMARVESMPRAAMATPYLQKISSKNRNKGSYNNALGGKLEGDADGDSKSKNRNNSRLHSKSKTWAYLRYHKKNEIR
jgi:hypothetical protein